MPNIILQGCTIDELCDALASRLSSSVQHDKPNTQPDQIITTAELCKRLDITEPTAIRWRRKGKIPFFNIGAAVRYNWPSVISALEKK